MAISSDVRTRARALNSFPVEFHGRARSIYFQRAARPDGVWADEDPVLPRGETAKDARLKRLPRSKAQICFESRECIGRLRGTRFYGLADFVFPVEIIRCGGNQSRFERLPRGKLLSNHAAQRLDLCTIAVESRRQTRKFVDHWQRPEVHFRKRHACNSSVLLRIAHVDAVGCERQFQ